MLQEDTDTIEVPRRTAEIAHRELGLLIAETTPSDPDETPMTPLAYLKQRVATELEVCDPESPAARAYQDTITMIDTLSEERGVETAPCDPLQDDIYTAHTTLATPLTHATAPSPVGGH